MSLRNHTGKRERKQKEIKRKGKAEERKQKDRESGK
jgi:hypothetical protein